MYKICVLLLCLLVSGCNDSSVNQINGNDQTKQPNSNEIVISNPLKTNFSIKDKFNQEVETFAVGEEITFELKVVNTTNSEVTYQATGPVHDFVVTKGGVEVWSEFYGMAFAQVITDRKIAANDTLVLTVKWLCKSNDGGLVQPGIYEVNPMLVMFLDGKKITPPDSKTIILN